MRGRAPRLVLLSPYGPLLWRETLALLPAFADPIIPLLPDEGDLASVAAHLLASLPPRAIIVGFCMGGYLAFELLRQAPERVVGLVLISASAAADGATMSAVRERRLASLRTKATQMTWPDPGYVGHAVAWLLSPRSFRCVHTLARAKAILAEVPVARSIHHQEMMLARPDSRADLPLIQVPSLVIGGREDRLVQAAALIEMARALPRARAELLEDCGHLVPVECPEAVAARIGDWMVAWGLSAEGVGDDDGRGTGAAGSHFAHLGRAARG